MLEGKAIAVASERFGPIILMNFGWRLHYCAIVFVSISNLDGSIEKKEFFLVNSSFFIRTRHRIVLQYQIVFKDLG